MHLSETSEKKCFVWLINKSNEVGRIACQRDCTVMCVAWTEEIAMAYHKEYSLWYDNILIWNFGELYYLHDILYKISLYIIKWYFIYVLLLKYLIPIVVVFNVTICVILKIFFYPRENHWRTSHVLSNWELNIFISSTMDNTIRKIWSLLPYTSLIIFCLKYFKGIPWLNQVFQSDIFF